MATGYMLSSPASGLRSDSVWRLRSFLLNSGVARHTSHRHRSTTCTPFQSKLSTQHVLQDVGKRDRATQRACCNATPSMGPTTGQRQRDRHPGWLEVCRILNQPGGPVAEIPKTNGLGRIRVPVAQVAASSQGTPRSLKRCNSPRWHLMSSTVLMDRIIPALWAAIRHQASA